jgi:hypothetical protein
MTKEHEDILNTEGYALGYRNGVDYIAYLVRKGVNAAELKAHTIMEDCNKRQRKSDDKGE